MYNSCVNSTRTKDMICDIYMKKQVRLLNTYISTSNPLKQQRAPTKDLKQIVSDRLSLLDRAAENARKRREALSAVGSVDINALPVSKISDVAANITAGYNDKVIMQTH
jgi:hypothetical protein